MKKFMVLMSITVFIIFTLSPDASAWEVTLENGTSYPVKFEIYGEHLFWEQVDCQKVVPPATIDKCVMPGAICPSSAQFSQESTGPGSPRGVLGKTNRVARCWNARASVLVGANRVIISLE